jgi:hypothetical protein
MFEQQPEHRPQHLRRAILRRALGVDQRLDVLKLGFRDLERAQHPADVVVISQIAVPGGLAHLLPAAVMQLVMRE